jgi:hypothetical protein
VHSCHFFTKYSLSVGEFNFFSKFSLSVGGFHLHLQHPLEYSFQCMMEYRIFIVMVYFLVQMWYLVEVYENLRCYIATKSYNHFIKCLRNIMKKYYQVGVCQNNLSRGNEHKIFWNKLTLLLAMYEITRA